MTQNNCLICHAPIDNGSFCRRCNEAASAKPPVVNRRKDTLEAAMSHVLKDRNATHGEPEDNFKTIAEYWTTYARSIGFKDITFGSKDVAAMMILMKCSRLATSPQRRDHWEDICGYGACGADVTKAE